MKRMFHATSVGVLGLAILIGCDALQFIIAPSTVSVSLVNRTGASVDVSMRYSSIENIPQALLEVSVDREETTVAALGQRTLGPFDCDDFQAVMIDDADLNVIGNIEDNTGDFHMGDDFDCGQTLVFTFTSPNAFALDIAFNAQ